jgi:hypothetical protein
MFFHNAFWGSCHTKGSMSFHFVFVYIHAARDYQDPAIRTGTWGLIVLHMF